MQFHIDDMTCGGCASTVKKTILTLDANATEFHHSGDDIRSAGLLAVVLHFDKPG